MKKYRPTWTKATLSKRRKDLAVFIEKLKAEQADNLELLLWDIQQNLLTPEPWMTEEQIEVIHDEAKQIVATIKAELLIRGGSQ